MTSPPLQTPAQPPAPLPPSVALAEVQYPPEAPAASAAAFLAGRPGAAVALLRRSAGPGAGAEEEGQQQQQQLPGSEQQRPASGYMLRAAALACRLQVSAGRASCAHSQGNGKGGRIRSKGLFAPSCSQIPAHAAPGPRQTDRQAGCASRGLLADHCTLLRDIACKTAHTCLLASRLPFTLTQVQVLTDRLL